MLTKVKDGILKRRLILDTKESVLKKSCRKNQRSILPRLLDVILQALAVMATLGVNVTYEDLVEFFVLDFSDAFWQIPLSPKERKFFAAMMSIKGIKRFLLFLRTVQGSRGAPLCWARLAALIMRLTQSLFPPKLLRLLALWTIPLQ